MTDIFASSPETDFRHMMRLDVVTTRMRTGAARGHQDLRVSCLALMCFLEHIHYLDCTATKLRITGLGKEVKQ